MSISINDAKHVARLARLDLQSAELELYTNQLNAVLNYAQELQKINTDAIKPTFYSVEEKRDLREDVVKEFSNKQRIIENGPDVSGTSFVVPRIL